MVYVFLANGFEETEAIVPLDILRRANVDVKTVGIGSDIITGSHGIKIVCDTTNENLSFENLQGIILPGGLPGVTNLEADDTVQKAIDYCLDNNLLIGAICAAPQILGHRNVFQGRDAVCYPGFESELPGATILKQKIAGDLNLITAIGAGASFEFGLEILAYLTDDATAISIKKSMKY